MSYYSLSTFERDVVTLACFIRNSGKNYDTIYGVPRGGVPLAIALSYELSISLIDPTSWELMLPYKDKILVVDELVDSGATRNRFKEYDFAVIHRKDCTKFEPTYFVSEQPGDIWINYWWEKEVFK